MQDGRLVQERQPYEIINCGNISFISSFNTIFQRCRIFEGKLARAADRVDLDPQPVDGIDYRRFPDFRRVADPDALAGLGHRLYASTRRSAALADTRQIGNYSAS